MDNIRRILFLGDKNFRNKLFLKYLLTKHKSEYKIDYFNQVIPIDIEKDFGRLNFESLKSPADINRNWDESIKYINSIEDIVYTYGLDSDHSEIDSTSLFFRLILRNFLREQRFSVPIKRNISKIFSSKKKSKIFIKEKYLLTYDLIIIDKLTEKVSKYQSVPENEKIQFIDEPKYQTPYYSYKISPKIINKLLQLNKKFLFLLNSGPEFETWSNTSLLRFNKILNRLKISELVFFNDSSESDNKKFPRLLTGVDLNNKLNDKISEFCVTINRDYKSVVPNKYSFLYKGVKKIFISSPTQIAPLKMNGFLDDNKILITGNNKTTTLYANWNDNEYHIRNRYEKAHLLYIDFKEYIINGFENRMIKDIQSIDLKNIEYVKVKNKKTPFKSKFDKIKFKDIDVIKLINIGDKAIERNINKIVINYFKNSLQKKISPIFGVIDIDESRHIYSMLTGNIFKDSFINNKECDNKIFIDNIIKCLLSQDPSDVLISDEDLPNIIINIYSGEIFINNKLIKLNSSLFCYYRYFAEQAKSGNNNFSVVETNPSIYKNIHASKIKGNEFVMSHNIIKKILQYYKDFSFPVNTDSKLRKNFENKLTPIYINYFPSIINKIEKAIRKELEHKMNDDVIEKILINKKSDFNYGLNLPPANITIQNNQSK